MDFKVAGTHKGITSIQMDLKIDGLTPEIIKEAFAVTHKEEIISSTSTSSKLSRDRETKSRSLLPR